MKNVLVAAVYLILIVEDPYFLAQSSSASLPAEFTGLNVFLFPPLGVLMIIQRHLALIPIFLLHTTY